MSEPLRVLVPQDGSPAALRAVQHVLDLAARGLAMEVHLLNVQPPVRGAAAALIAQSELDAYHRDEGMKALADARAMLVVAGALQPHLHVSVGSPGEIVVAFIARLRAGLVIMGTRGYGGGVAGMVMGSVASHVVTHSLVPVTLLNTD